MEHLAVAELQGMGGVERLAELEGIVGVECLAESEGMVRVERLAVAELQGMVACCHNSVWQRLPLEVKNLNACTRS